MRPLRLLLPPQNPEASAPFHVQLELHGLPAGRLEGHMRLEVGAGDRGVNTPQRAGRSGTAAG